MDNLDKAKELIVEAMGALEHALIDGLPAQAPSSDIDQVCDGLDAFKRRIEEARAFVKQTEGLLD